MRVIHLMSTDDYSGAENVAINIVSELQENTDIYYATRSGKILDFLKDNNIKNIIIIDKLSIKEIKRIEKEYNPDIIHAHDYKATIIATLAIKNAKIVSHLHNNSPWIRKIYHPYTWALLFASARISKILTVSDSIPKEYIFSRFIRKKIVVISNPISIKKIKKNINYEAYSPIYDICFVGRLTKQKNPIKFIHVINNLKKDFPNINAVMIGDGELREECQHEIDTLNLNRNIKLYGFLKNPYEEMVKSKTFCLTSDWEGFGLVAFEAIALGIPSIVSNVGGLPSIIDEQCGFLCNNMNEFITELSNLLNDKELYDQKSKCALEKAKKLENITEYMNKIKNIYNEII